MGLQFLAGRYKIPAQQQALNVIRKKNEHPVLPQHFDPSYSIMQQSE
jgi:hypothetical protein